MIDKLVSWGVLHPTPILVAEAALCCVILLMVPYTEIDWIAYMQEVRGFLDGELDYKNLRGDTGPLVYPAGFVYFYSALYYLTALGKHVFLAQCIFGVFYLLTQSVVMRLYTASGVHPVWLLTLIFSKRIHSIFLLRMFNDGVAIMLAYMSFLLICVGLLSNKRNWVIGCLFYSAAVSVKMNIFLFAPGLLFLMLKHHSITKTIGLLSVCASLQLVVGAPFLAHNWVSYLSKAFELSRVFTYKWTVNMKFLDEETFVDPRLGIALLVLTVASWAWMAATRWQHRRLSTVKGMVLTLFESNMIGIIFCRSMHYQFYSWFYHQLPFVLLCSCTALPVPFKIVVLVFVEYGFNTYPSTVQSSAALMFALGVTWFFMMISKDTQDLRKSLPPAKAAAQRAAVTAKKKQ